MASSYTIGASAAWPVTSAGVQRPVQYWPCSTTASPARRKMSTARHRHSPSRARIIPGLAPVNFSSTYARGRATEGPLTRPFSGPEGNRTPDLLPAEERRLLFDAAGHRPVMPFALVRLFLLRSFQSLGARAFPQFRQLFVNAYR